MFSQRDSLKTCAVERKPPPNEPHGNSFALLHFKFYNTWNRNVYFAGRDSRSSSLPRNYKYLPSRLQQNVYTKTSKQNREIQKIEK